MTENNTFNEQCITTSQMNLIFNARLFWRRLSVWTTLYIVSRYRGVGTAEELFGRLYLENSNFGDMLQIVFGRNLANQYSDLLNQYSIDMRQLISAQLQGNAGEVNRRVNQLYQNADNRADFLASINPYFNEAEWKKLLETYLQFTLEQINEFISGDFSKFIELFDKTTALTNQMGDVFAQELFEYITSGLQCSLKPEGGQQCFTYDQMNEIYEIRMFWFDMIVWSRAYMMSKYNGVGKPEELLARLKQVAVNYTNRLKQIFGQSEETNIDQDLKLINRHIDLIAALIDAQSAGKTEEVARITQELYKNADERAAFLASVNPYWSKSEWQNRLYRKMKGIIDESTSFLTRNYAQNLDIFSTLLGQAESTGDYYWQGLQSFISSRHFNE